MVYCPISHWRMIIDYIVFVRSSFFFFRFHYTESHQGTILQPHSDCVHCSYIPALVFNFGIAIFLAWPECFDGFFWGRHRFDLFIECQKKLNMI